MRFHRPRVLSQRSPRLPKILSDHGCGGFAVICVLAGAWGCAGTSSNFGAAGATRWGGRIASAGADVGLLAGDEFGLAISSKPLSSPCMPFLNSTTLLPMYFAMS